MNFTPLQIFGLIELKGGIDKLLRKNHEILG